MTIGVAPITGIPLPFVSIGGSSMMTNLLATGRFLPGDAVRGPGAERRCRAAPGCAALGSIREAALGPGGRVADRRPTALVSQRPAPCARVAGARTRLHCRGAREAVRGGGARRSARVDRARRRGAPAGGVSCARADRRRVGRGKPAVRARHDPPSSSRGRAQPSRRRGRRGRSPRVLADGGDRPRSAAAACSASRSVDELIARRRCRTPGSRPRSGYPASTCRS